MINLDVLEPFQPQEVKYTLDGKSGVLRLKLLFKPEYVTRQRQGSSTFSGTFAPAGKVVGAPVKGVTAVGGGVIKGASFLKRGFTRNKSSRDEPMGPNGTIVDGSEPMPTTSPQGTPARAVGMVDGSMSTPQPSTPLTPHNRPRSIGSTQGGTPRGAESGTANLTVVSATGYPPSAEVRVSIRMISARGNKEIHKTKAIKSSSSTVEFSPDHESFKVPCTADTQFQVLVKAHGTFGSKDLGEGLFFVSDQGNGAEQSIKAGDGSIILRTGFTAIAGAISDGPKPGTTSGRSSPDSKRDVRRSLFSKRDVSAKQDPPS